MILEQLIIFFVALVNRWKLSNGVVPESDALLVIGSIGLRQMEIKEMVNKFEYSDCWFVPRNNAEKAFKHLAKCLNQHLWLIGNQRGEGVGLYRVDYYIGVELAFRQQSWGQVYERPQYFRVVRLLKYLRGNREYLVQNVPTVHCCTPKRHYLIQRVAAVK